MLALSCASAIPVSNQSIIRYKEIFLITGWQPLRLPRIIIIIIIIITIIIIIIIIITIIMAEMAVILLWLATSNEGDACGL